MIADEIDDRGRAQHGGKSKSQFHAGGQLQLVVRVQMRALVNGAVGDFAGSVRFEKVPFLRPDERRVFSLQVGQEKQVGPLFFSRWTAHGDSIPGKQLVRPDAIHPQVKAPGCGIPL